MGRRRLKLRDLRRILSSFGVNEDVSKGKGSHTLFWKDFPDGRYSLPIPKNKDVLPCYVSQARRKFRLTEEDGVTDEDFFWQGVAPSTPRPGDAVFSSAG